MVATVLLVSGIAAPRMRTPLDLSCYPSRRHTTRPKQLTTALATGLEPVTR